MTSQSGTAHLDELNTELHVLQSHLDSLIKRVRENDIKSRRFGKLEMTMLTLNSLRELMEQTLEDTRSVFDLDHVTLALIDDKKELYKYLQEDGLSPDKASGLVFLESPQLLEKCFGKLMRPYLGPFRREYCCTLFKHLPASSQSSVVLLPLFRRGRLLGSLNMASENPGRFSERMSTDFLDRLSAVLTVCLENTLNFELLRRTSLIDTLTGVNNRRFFDQRIDEEINRVVRGGACLSCLFLDIDHFKRVNDVYGHTVGDLALQTVSRTLRSSLRTTDYVARWGGEEFLVLLINIRPEKLLTVANKIRLLVSNSTIATDDEAFHVTVSIGATLIRPSESQAQVIARADALLYQSKQMGRNRVSLD